MIFEFLKKFEQNENRVKKSSHSVGELKKSRLSHFGPHSSEIQENSEEKLPKAPGAFTDAFCTG